MRASRSLRNSPPAIPCSMIRSIMPLVANFDRADALARGLRQEAALAQEDDRVVEPLGEGREVLEDELPRPSPSCVTSDLEIARARLA